MNMKPSQPCPSALLEQKIRRGDEPDNPRLLSQLLVRPLSSTDNCLTTRREQLIGQYQLLSDTVRDASLPFHWRSLCLDHLYYPLFALRQLADCPQSRDQARVLFNDMKRLAPCLPSTHE